MFGNFPVWYDPNEIVNVLSLKTIKDHYLVTYNSYDRGVDFTVHMSNGTIKFIQHPRGLHYLDLNKTLNAHILMMIVNENIEGYTKQAIDGAMKVLCLQGMMGHPLQHDFENLICDQL